MHCTKLTKQISYRTLCDRETFWIIYSLAHKMKFTAELLKFNQNHTDSK